MPNNRSESDRNYKEEYRKWHSSEEAKKRRAQRNAARREMEEDGRVHKGDGKDVDHKNNNLGGNLSNARSNLRVMDRSENRSRNNNDGHKRKKK